MEMVTASRTSRSIFRLLLLFSLLFLATSHSLAVEREGQTSSYPFALQPTNPQRSTAVAGEAADLDDPTEPIELDGLSSVPADEVLLVASGESLRQTEPGQRGSTLYLQTPATIRFLSSAPNSSTPSTNLSSTTGPGSQGSPFSGNGYLSNISMPDMDQGAGIVVNGSNEISIIGRCGSQVGPNSSYDIRALVSGVSAADLCGISLQTPVLSATLNNLGIGLESTAFLRFLNMTGSDFSSAQQISIQGSKIKISNLGPATNIALNVSNSSGLLELSKNTVLTVECPGQGSTSDAIQAYGIYGSTLQESASWSIKDGATIDISSHKGNTTSGLYGAYLTGSPVMIQFLDSTTITVNNKASQGNAYGVYFDPQNSSAAATRFTFSNTMNISSDASGASQAIPSTVGVLAKNSCAKFNFSKANMTVEAKGSKARAWGFKASDQDRGELTFQDSLFDVYSHSGEAFGVEINPSSDSDSVRRSYIFESGRIHARNDQAATTGTATAIRFKGSSAKNIVFSCKPASLNQSTGKNFLALAEGASEARAIDMRGQLTFEAQSMPDRNIALVALAKGTDATKAIGIDASGTVSGSTSLKSTLSFNGSTNYIVGAKVANFSAPTGGALEASYTLSNDKSGGAVAIQTFQTNVNLGTDTGQTENYLVGGIVGVKNLAPATNVQIGRSSGSPASGHTSIWGTSKNVKSWNLYGQLKLKSGGSNQSLRIPHGAIPFNDIRLNNLPSGEIELGPDETLTFYVDSMQQDPAMQGFALAKGFLTMEDGAKLSFIRKESGSKGGKIGLKNISSANTLPTSTCYWIVRGPGNAEFSKMIGGSEMAVNTSAPQLIGNLEVYEVQNWADYLITNAENYVKLTNLKLYWFSDAEKSGLIIGRARPNIVIHGIYVGNENVGSAADTYAVDFSNSKGELTIGQGYDIYVTSAAEKTSPAEQKHGRVIGVLADGSLKTLDLSGSITAKNTSASASPSTAVIAVSASETSQPAAKNNGAEIKIHSTADLLVEADGNSLLCGVGMVNSAKKLIVDAGSEIKLKRNEIPVAAGASSPSASTAGDMTAIDARNTLNTLQIAGDLEVSSPDRVRSSIYGINAAGSTGGTILKGPADASGDPLYRLFVESKAQQDSLANSHQKVIGINLDNIPTDAAKNKTADLLKVEAGYDIRATSQAKGNANSASLTDTTAAIIAANGVAANTITLNSNILAENTNQNATPSTAVYGLMAQDFYGKVNHTGKIEARANGNSQVHGINVSSSSSKECGDLTISGPISATRSATEVNGTTAVYGILADGSTRNITFTSPGKIDAISESTAAISSNVCGLSWMDVSNAAQKTLNIPNGVTISAQSSGTGDGVSSGRTTAVALSSADRSASSTGANLGGQISAINRNGSDGLFAKVLGLDAKGFQGNLALGATGQVTATLEGDHGSVCGLDMTNGGTLQLAAGSKILVTSHTTALAGDDNAHPEDGRATGLCVDGIGKNLSSAGYVLVKNSEPLAAEGLDPSRSFLRGVSAKAAASSLNFQAIKSAANSYPAEMQPIQPDRADGITGDLSIAPIMVLSSNGANAVGLDASDLPATAQLTMATSHDILVRSNIRSAETVGESGIVVGANLANAKAATPADASAKTLSFSNAISARNFNADADKNTRVYGVLADGVAKDLIFSHDSKIFASNVGKGTVYGIKADGIAGSKFTFNGSLTAGGFDGAATDNCVYGVSVDHGHGTFNFGDDAAGGSIRAISKSTNSGSDESLIGLAAGNLGSSSANTSLDIGNKFNISAEGNFAESGQVYGAKISTINAADRAVINGSIGAANSNAASTNGVKIIGLDASSMAGELAIGKGGSVDSGRISASSAGQSNLIGLLISDTKGGSISLGDSAVVDVRGHNVRTANEASQIIGVYGNDAGELISSGSILVRNRAQEEKSEGQALLTAGIILDNPTKKITLGAVNGRTPSGDASVNGELLLNGDIADGPISVESTNGGLVLGLKLGCDKIATNDLDIQEGHHIVVRGNASSSKAVSGQGYGDGAVIGVAAANLLAQSSSPNKLSFGGIISAQNFNGDADATTEVIGIFAPNCKKEIVIPTAGAAFASAKGNSRTTGIDLQNSSGNFTLAGSVGSKNGTADPDQVGGSCYGVRADGASGQLKITGDSADRLASITAQSSAANGANVIGFSRQIAPGVSDRPFHMRFENAKVEVSSNAESGTDNNPHLTIGLDLDGAASTLKAQAQKDTYQVIVSNANPQSKVTTSVYGIRVGPQTARQNQSTVLTSLIAPSIQATSAGAGNIFGIDARNCTFEPYMQNDDFSKKTGLETSSISVASTSITAGSATKIAGLLLDNSTGGMVINGPISVTAASSTANGSPNVVGLSRIFDGSGDERDDAFALEQKGTGGLSVTSKARSGQGLLSGAAIGFNISGDGASTVSLAGSNSVTNDNASAASNTNVVGFRGQNFKGSLTLRQNGNMAVTSAGAGNSISFDLLGCKKITIEPNFLIQVSGHNSVTDPAVSPKGQTIGINLANAATPTQLGSTGFIVVRNHRLGSEDSPATLNGEKSDTIGINGTNLATETALEFGAIVLSNAAPNANIPEEFRTLEQDKWVDSAHNEVAYGTVHVADEAGGNTIGINLASSHASLSMGQNNNLTVRGSATTGKGIVNNSIGRGSTVGIDYSQIQAPKSNAANPGNLDLQNTISVRNTNIGADGGTTVCGLFADGSGRSISIGSNGAIFASAAGKSNVYGIHAAPTTQGVTINGNIFARNSMVLTNGSELSEVCGVNLDGSAGKLILGSESVLHKEISVDGSVTTGGGGNVVVFSRLLKDAPKDPKFDLTVREGYDLKGLGSLSSDGTIVGVDLAGDEPLSSVDFNGTITVTNRNENSDTSSSIYGFRTEKFEGAITFGGDSAIQVNGAGKELVTGILAQNCSKGLSVQGKVAVSANGSKVTGETKVYGAQLDNTIGVITFGGEPTVEQAMTLESNTGVSAPATGAELCGIHWHTKDESIAGATMNIKPKYAINLQSAINAENCRTRGIDLRGPNKGNKVNIYGSISVKNTNMQSKTSSAIYGVYANDYRGKLALLPTGSIAVSAAGDGNAYGIFCDGKIDSTSELEIAGSIDIKSARDLNTDTNSALYGLYVSRTGGPITCFNGSKIRVTSTDEKDATGIHISGNSSVQNILLEENSSIIVQGENVQGGDLTGINFDDSNANVSLQNHIIVKNANSSRGTTAYGVRSDRSSGKISFEGNGSITGISSSSGQNNTIYGVCVHEHELTDEDAVNAKVDSRWNCYACSDTGNATAFEFDSMAGGGIDLGAKNSPDRDEASIVITALAKADKSAVGLRSGAKKIKIHAKTNYITGLSGIRSGFNFDAGSSATGRAILLKGGADLELGRADSTNYIIGGIQSDNSSSAAKPMVTFFGNSKLWGKCEGIQTWDVRGAVHMMATTSHEIRDAYRDVDRNGNSNLSSISLSNVPPGSLTLRSGELLQFYLEKEGDGVKSSGILNLEGTANSLRERPQLIFDGGKIATRSLSIGIADLTKDLELMLVNVDPSCTTDNYGALIKGMEVGEIIKGRTGLYSISNEESIFDRRLSSYVEEKELHLAFSKAGNAGTGLVLIKIPDEPEDLIGHGTCCIKTTTGTRDIKINLGNGTDVPQLTNPDYYLKEDGTATPFEESEGYILRFKTAGEKAVLIVDSVDNGSIEFCLHNASPAIEVINDNLSTKIVGVDASGCKSNLTFSNNDSQRPLQAAYEIDYPTDFLNTAIALRNSMPTSASYGLSVDRARRLVSLDKNCDINVESKSLHSAADTIGINAEGANGLQLNQNTIASNFNAYSSGKVYGIYAKNSAGPIRTANASISAISYGSGTVCGINAEMGTEQEVDLETSGKCNIFAYNASSSGSAVGLMATSSCEKGSVILGDRNQSEKVCIMGLNGMANEGECVTCGISAFGSLTPISLQASKNCVVGLSGKMESKKFNDLRFRASDGAAAMAVEIGGGNLSYKNITQTLGEEIIHVGCPDGENFIIGGFGKRSGEGTPDTKVILEGTTTLWGRSFGVREWDIHGPTVLSTSKVKRIENAVLCSVKNGLDIPPPVEVVDDEASEEEPTPPPPPDVLDLSPILLCNLPNGSIRLENGEALTFNLRKERNTNILEGSLRLAAPEGTLCHQLIFPNGNHGKIAVQSAMGAELDSKIDLRLIETLINPDYLIDGLYRGDELESGVYFIDHEEDYFDNRLSSYSQIQGLHLLLSYRPGQMGVLLRSNLDEKSSLALTDYAQRFANAELGTTLMESVSMLQNGLKNSFDDSSNQENMPFLFAVGAHTYQGNNDGFGYKNNTYGVAFGAHHMTWFKERLQNDAIRIGAIAGCMRSKLDFFGENVANGKTARQDIYLLGLIGRFNRIDGEHRELKATGMIGGLLTRNHLQRRDEELAAFDAKFNSQSFFANIDGAQNMYAYRGVKFGPWVGANYQFVHQSGYQERSASAVGAATLAPVDQHIFNVILGLNAERNLADLLSTRGNLNGALKLGGRYQSSKISAKRNASIDGIGLQSFSPIFTKGDRYACVASASIRDQLDKNWNVSGSWEGVFSSHYTYNNLTFGLEYVF